MLAVNIARHAAGMVFGSSPGVSHSLIDNAPQRREEMISSDDVKLMMDIFGREQVGYSAAESRELHRTEENVAAFKGRDGYVWISASRLSR
jgi:hypothetical protein